MTTAQGGPAMMLSTVLSDAAPLFIAFPPFAKPCGRMTNVRCLRERAGVLFEHDFLLRLTVEGSAAEFARGTVNQARQLAETSELGQLLKQIKALRVELRFCDNGLHTLLSIKRK
jgi:hypothetical protein